MRHAIYAGSFAALEERWLETVSGLQREDPLLETNVLIGSNILASYLKGRLVGAGRTVANIRFHTFLDLVSRLSPAWQSPSSKPRLPGLGSSIILQQILDQSTPEVYGQVAGFRGFRDALLETFRDLRDAGIEPDQLNAPLLGNGRDPDRRAHLLAFADLYRRFRRRVSSFTDVDDDFRNAMRNAAHATRFASQTLLVYGVYDATGQQAALLSTLKQSTAMIYFIPYVRESVSEFARPFLASLVEELGVECVELDERRPTFCALGRLAEVDFGWRGSSGVGSASAGARAQVEPSDSLRPESPGPADGSVVLVSAPGDSRAAVEIVREILRGVRDGVIRGFHEAAVILRQPETDIPILTEMLRLRGIPYFVHGGSSLSERPLSRAIMALCELESNSFSRESVLVALELISAALPEDSGWDVQSWRAQTMDPGFLAGLHSWDQGIDRLVAAARREMRSANADSPAEADSMQLLRKRLACVVSLRDSWLLVRQASSGWPAALSWGDWASFLEERLAPIFGEGEDWPLFAEVLDELAELQTIADSEASASVSCSMLQAALADALASHSCSVGRFRQSGVNLLSMGAARGLRFPLVIIPGLDEGRFPARVRQDPLLFDVERDRMSGLPLKARRVEEERLLFDMAARAAEKRLVLTTSRLDESSDRERIPSQFFLRVASALSRHPVSIRDLEEGAVPGFRSVSLDNPAPPRHEVPADEGEIRLRAAVAGRGSGMGGLRALAALDPQRFRHPLAYDQARWMDRLTPYDGRIGDARLVAWTAQKIGVSAGQVSASRIEEYAKCPYAFFLKRVMDLQPWEEPGTIEGMNPLERGTAIHSILEGFLKCFGDAAFQPAMADRLRQESREVLEQSRPPGIPDLLWEIERDALVAMLMGWAEFERTRSDGDLMIARLEQPFGTFGVGESFPALRVEAGRHVFEFRGRIDRVDLSRDGKRARVVDYKTGMLPDSMSSPESRTPLMAGERIQLVLYRGALAVLEEFSGVERAEGEYLHLQPRDGRTAPCRFTDDELREAERALPAILEMIGDGIERGVFFPRTSGRLYPYGHCTYCDYLAVCGKDRIRREERRRQDPDVQRFLHAVESW